MFTILIFSSLNEEDNNKSYCELTKNLKDINFNNTKIIDINIDNIDQLIIFCDNKNFVKNKLKLLNTSKQELETFPNLTNYLQRNFFGNFFL